MKKILASTLASLGIVILTLTTSLPAFAAVDAELPGDVENLTGTALNAAVKLSWNATTDNVGVKGYQVHYGTSAVTETGQTYEKIVDVGNVLEYTVDKLTNGTKYYFSVIAYDAAGNESLHWATPKLFSLTPSQDAGNESDKEAPKVSKAEALNKEEVKVEFSEEIVLPAEDPQDAFTIDNDDNLESLAVLSAKMDETDATKKTVILGTVAQTVGTSYKLTVDIDIEDKAGNPIISGTSDTAVFTGSAEEKPATDSVGPELVKVESSDNTHIVINFNEAVVLDIDPSKNFTIAEEQDATKTLQVLGVELAKNSAGLEDAAAIITTSAQEDKSYIATAVKLKDEAGNEVNATKGSGVFKGTPKGAVVTPNDIIPPKDVAKFLAKSVLNAGKYIVTLTWEIPAENKSDVKEQLVYMSQDKGQKYDKKATLDFQATKYEVKDLTAGEYWFKVTQKDAAGNESAGVITKVILSETGPEMIGLVLASLVLGRIVGKKRKNK